MIKVYFLLNHSYIKKLIRPLRESNACLLLDGKQYYHYTKWPKYIFSTGVEPVSSGLQSEVLAVRRKEELWGEY